MRVTLVAGHFTPELGYQEVYLARAFARLRHEVTVVASNRASPSARRALEHDRYPAGASLDERHGFKVERLPALAQFGAVVYARHLREAVERSQPEVVVAIGPGKLFPAPVFRAMAQHRLVVIFGDNRDFWSFSRPSLALRSIRMAAARVLLKDPVYRRAVANADRLIWTTPETEKIVLSRISSSGREAAHRRGLFVPLGFDSDEFFYSAEDREAERDEIGASTDEMVFVTCTRVTPEKGLEQIVDHVSSLRRHGHSVRYVVAGFLGDSYGQSLQRYIENQPEPDIFITRPFLGHEAARRLYCGADVGIWTRAAISIQEAMGTGLPVLVEDKQSIRHLVVSGRNGWVFPRGEAQSGLTAALHGGLPDRVQIAAANAGRLSYDVLAERILSSEE